MAVRVLEGHVIDVLNALPEKTFHLTVCSPPYWLLRAYGTPPQVWGGMPGCDHDWGEAGRSGTRLRNGQGSRVVDGGVKGLPLTLNPPTGNVCSLCGAWRGELGQEPTVEGYLDHLVACMDAVGRVLRDDGSLWVNLSGCYFSNPGGQNGGSISLNNGTGTSTQGGRTKLLQQHQISIKAVEANRQQGRVDRTGGASKGKGWLKPLDYVDVPGLFAHRMQERGWIWRNDIALVKRSPLPESVRGWAWERCRRKLTEGDQSPGTGQRKVSAVRVEEHGNRDVGSFESQEARAEWADCPGCPKCASHDGLVLRRGNGRATRAWERLLVFIKRPGAFWDTESVRQPEAESTRERAYLGVRPLTPQQRHMVESGTWGETRTLSDYGRTGANLRDWLTWEVQPNTESIRTVQRVDVSPDEAGHDTVRIPSPDCLVHGHLPDATPGHDARSDAPLPRSSGSGSRRVQVSPVGPAATPLLSWAAEQGSLPLDPDGSPVATGHSTSARRTAPAPVTTDACTPSAETPSHTGDMSGSLSAAARRPGTPENRVSTDVSAGPQLPETSGRTAHMSPVVAPSLGHESATVHTSHSDGNSTEVVAGSVDSPSGQTADGSTRTPTACTCSFYKEIIKETAHYSAFPPFIPRLAIQAGTSEAGCCPTCGAPWARCIDRQVSEVTRKTYAAATAGATPSHRGSVERPGGYEFGESTTLGWRQTCACPPHTPVKCRVLDCFSGAGTTVMQADRLGRDGTGVELQPDYVALSRRRVTGDAPLLVEWAETPAHQQLSMLDMAAGAG